MAREIYRLLTNPPAAIDGARLRAARTDAGVSLRKVAAAVGSWPTRVSQLERGIIHDAELASRCDAWLQDRQVA